MRRALLFARWSALPTLPRFVQRRSGVPVGRSRELCFASGVHLFFDESGDYSFPTGRFDCYAQAALLCPDKLVGEIDDFVEGCKVAWSVDELHAAELTRPQLNEIAEFIARSDLSLLASLTDTELITTSDIERHRLDQAAITKRNLDWYRRASTRGCPDRRGTSTAIHTG